MNRMIFTTIGFVEHHKGQDVLVDAIKTIDKEMLLKCRFLFVGKNDSLYAEELKKQIVGYSCIEMLGSVSREQIHRILKNTNVLICPSREDTMPTVCAEAMMHSVPCLVSDAIGTAAYIKNGNNGLIFENENSTELKAQIVWCIQHSTELKEMGNRAYEIYERLFSPKVFEENLLMFIEEMIGEAR